MSGDGVRLYGNQYGTWVQITDKKLAARIDAFCRNARISPEQFLHLAVEEYIDGIEALYFLEMEHQDRTKARTSSSMD